MSITVRFQHSGQFEIKSDRMRYINGLVHIKNDVDPDRLSKLDLEDYMNNGVGVDNIKELWYLEVGKSINNGLKQLLVDNDIMTMVNSVGRDRVAHIYVVKDNDLSPSIIRRSTYILKACSSQFQASHNQSCQISEIDDDNLLDNDIVVGSDSSSSDGDFSFKDSEDEDGDIFTEFVENIAVDNTFKVVVHKGKDDEVALDVVLSDSDFLRSGSDSDQRKTPRYLEFNPHVDFMKPIVFKNDMVFGSNDIFRRALRQFAIEKKRDYYYLHNDKLKVSAYCKYKCECSMKHGRKKCECKESLCDSKACARRIGVDGSFQLKSFNHEHKCGWRMQNKKVTSVWLAEKYLENYRDDSRWRLKAFKNAVARDHDVEISFTQACRARIRAYIMCQGDASSQYGKVWNYATTIIKWNPGSSAYVKVNLDYPERPIFQRLYICLDACKKGFLEGCRPILGVDGCHLKGAYTGQILSAVGKDGNDNIFPVAYAVVEAERKETWIWFLENLMRDLNHANITFMSDRQKGLLEALHYVVPLAETRVCVRHLHNNFKVKWGGKAYKDALWAAARATTKYDFNVAMNFIKSLEEGAFSYLMKAEPRTWSNHAFKHDCKSDMLLNNVCESFNSFTLEARELPILTMCEWIRRKLMKRFVLRREGMKNVTSSITSKALKRMESLQKNSFSMCKVEWAGDQRYEVDHFDRRYVVDLSLRRCGCVKWDLTGIPCVHAIACISLRSFKLEDYVDKYYTKETYLKAYGQIVQPLPGEIEWEQIDIPPPHPPQFIIQLGRPKKARRREQGEEAPKKQQRYRVGKNKCFRCGVEGHTRPKCVNPPKSQEAPKAKKRRRETKKRKHHQNYFTN